MTFPETDIEIIPQFEIEIPAGGTKRHEKAPQMGTEGRLLLPILFFVFIGTIGFCIWRSFA